MFSSFLMIIVCWVLHGHGWCIGLLIPETDLFDLILDIRMWAGYIGSLSIPLFQVYVFYD